MGVGIGIGWQCEWGPYAVSVRFASERGRGAVRVPEAFGPWQEQVLAIGYGSPGTRRCRGGFLRGKYLPLNCSPTRPIAADRKALLPRLHARPGTVDEVRPFLEDAPPRAEDEDKTIAWYALQINDTTFGIFDTFAGEEGRQPPSTARLPRNCWHRPTSCYRRRLRLRRLRCWPRNSRTAPPAPHVRPLGRDWPEVLGAGDRLE